MLIPLVYEELPVSVAVVKFQKLPAAGHVKTELVFTFGPVNYTFDGSLPTANVGKPGNDGDTLTLTQAEAVRFQAIRQGALDGTVRAHHYTIA